MNYQDPNFLGYGFFCKSAPKLCKECANEIPVKLRPFLGRVSVLRPYGLILATPMRLF